MTLKKKQKDDKAALFLRVDRKLKDKIKKICDQQPGQVSQSTVIQLILNSALSNPDFVLELYKGL